jgi:hypothetical protein
MPTPKSHSRKQIARTFLRLAATGKVREAYERFVDKSFRHHNPYFPSRSSARWRKAAWSRCIPG